MTGDSWILTAVVVAPLLGAVMMLLPPRGDDVAVRRSALFASMVTLVIAIYALVLFYEKAPETVHADSSYLLRMDAPWIALGDGDEAALIPYDASRLTEPKSGIGYRVGVDGISIWLVVMTAFLMPLAVWSSFTGITKRTREYYCLLLILESGLLGVFCALDVLLFYMFFEFTLIPLFFLIGIWGGTERRRAAFKFFIYTLAGSVLTFAGVIYLAFYTYTELGFVTLSMEELTAMGQGGGLSYSVQWWLFLAFAAGFAIKVPLFPVHTWLPLAHTEAPTAGSVILAGVLLKLGTYGFCRLSIPILPAASFELGPVVAVLAIIGIVYAALAAWVQDDVKKLVAYSSVSHLGFCMLGLFSLKVAGVSGAVLYMVNHGLSTGALFLVIGFMYERYHTRSIKQIGGLAKPMPWLAFFLIFFTLSSIGLPGLNGFVSEFLVLVGTATSQSVDDLRAPGPLGFAYVIPAATGIVLSAVYMLWMCQHLLFGPLKEPPNTPDTSSGLPGDLSGREKAILAPIAVCCLVLGVYPKPVLDTINVAVQQHVLMKTAGTTYVMDVDGSEDDAPLPLPLLQSELQALARADSLSEPRASARADFPTMTDVRNSSVPNAKKDSVVMSTGHLPARLE